MIHIRCALSHVVGRWLDVSYWLCERFEWAYPALKTDFGYQWAGRVSSQIQGDGPGYWIHITDEERAAQNARIDELC